MLNTNNLISNFVNYNKNLKFMESYILVKPEIKYENDILFYDYNTEEFVDVISRLNVNLDVLKDNLKTLKIVNSCDTLYDDLDNILYVDTKNKEELYFGLLTVATTYYYNDIIYSGFEQNDALGNIAVGTGINYAYKNLLVNNLLNLDNDNIYTNIAKLLEIVIGKEELLNLFFNTDLNTLFNKLSNYSSKEETFEFIKNIDYIYRLNENNNVESLMENCLMEIKMYLLNILSRVNCNYNTNDVINLINSLNINKKLIK